MVVYLDDCADGELRLVDGETEWEGRLEICIGQRWGTVGSDGWTEVNSQVVCNTFGYDFTGMLIQFSMGIICLFLFLKTNFLLAFCRRTG